MAAPLFNVELMPRRSLSKRGFRLLMGSAAGCGLVIGTTFLIRGVWPVLPYFGLEIALLYLAFRMNYRAAKARETVQLTTQALTVERVKPSGRTDRFRFQPPHWLRVTRKPGRAATIACDCRASHHGRRLPTPVSGAVAAELRRALARLTASPAGSGG